MLKSRVMRGGWRAFLADRSGTPAMEFALIGPVLLTFLMAGFDTANLIICKHHTNAAAQQIVKIATELAVQADQTSALTINQMYQAETAVYPSNPMLYNGATIFAVIISGVVYTTSPANCTPGVDCVYTANVAWSVPLAQGLYVRRPCGVVAQTSTFTPGSLVGLPTAGMTALTSLVVVDVIQIYKPVTPLFFGYAQFVASTAMLVPRVGGPNQYVEYDPVGAQAGTNPYACTGYL